MKKYKYLLTFTHFNISNSDFIQLIFFEIKLEFEPLSPIPPAFP